MLTEGFASRLDGGHEADGTHTRELPDWWTATSIISVFIFRRDNASTAQGGSLARNGDGTGIHVANESWGVPWRSA